MEAAEITKVHKTQQVRSNKKVMLTFFFNFRGIVHHEYAPEDQTINKKYYCTRKFYVAFVMLCKESGQTCGHGRTGSFTMKMLPLIPPCNQRFFWPKTKRHLCDSFWLLLAIPQVKNYAQRDVISVT